MTDDVTHAARAVAASYDAGDPLDVPILSLKLAISEADRARFRDEANRYWLECSALRAQLDDAERERSDYAAAVDAHRDRIAELERECGELAGRIGGLEYDLGAAAIEAEAQRAHIAQLTAERDALTTQSASYAARIVTLERQAAAPPDLSPRLAGAATAARQVARTIDAPLDPCPHCGQQTFKSQISRTQHVNYCPKNPSRLRAPNSKAKRDAKRAAALAATPAQEAAEPVVMGARFCQFCRAPFSPKGTALEQHEPRCPENPNRMAPPDLVRQITLSVDPSETYTCPACGGTTFAKALTADRCMNCDNKQRIGKAAA